MKVIVYQGTNEQFRTRLVDDDGNAVEFETEPDGKTHVKLSDLYERQADAVLAAARISAEHDNCEVEVRETIAEVAARG